jgi:hypothetical protein
MDQRVLLPCSRLRRKAATLDGMQWAHDASGTARFARLTQPGSGQEQANGGLPKGQEALSM